MTYPNTQLFIQGEWRDEYLYAMLAEENARRNGFAANLKVIHADVKDALRKGAAKMPEPGTLWRRLRKMRTEVRASAATELASGPAWKARMPAAQAAWSAVYAAQRLAIAPGGSG